MLSHPAWERGRGVGYDSELTRVFVGFDDAMETSFSSLH